MHCCQYINCNNKIGCIWFGKENSFTQQNVTNSVPNFISRGESQRVLSSTGFTHDLKLTSVFIKNIIIFNCKADTLPLDRAVHYHINKSRENRYLLNGPLFLTHHYLDLRSQMPYTSSIHVFHFM